jgi:CcmD family protein
MKNIITLSLLILLPSLLSAQETQQVEMADALFQSGKIYVVVTILSVIFVGIVAYLIAIDRKISKLEKEINKK